MGLAVAPAAAQTCRIPPVLEAPREEIAPPGAAIIARRTGHVLALSWSPQFCRTNGGQAQHASQCRGQSFGFILHGLWADGEGRNNPVWCKRVEPVPLPVLRATFCTTPSAGLMAHEWAKHGSCLAPDAAAYFERGRRLFAGVLAPDMDGLSRRRLTVREFKSAFAVRNRGWPASSISLLLDRQGWLKEVRLCLDLADRPRPCPADLRGPGGGVDIKIWRGS